MDPIEIIAEYYEPGSRAFDILVRHSRQVAQKALAAACHVRHLDPDLGFIQEAAMLHDIGIFMTRSPSLGCHGDHPYVCHGVLGRKLLDKRGLPRHALVCERHVGVGISMEDVREQNLPLPLRDMRPQTLEEEVICYADKFFSKNGEGKDEKTPRQILKSLERFGSDKGIRFRSWEDKFTP